MKVGHEVVHQYQLYWDYDANRPGGNLLVNGTSRGMSQADVDNVLASMQWERHGNYWVERDGERCLVYVPDLVLDYWRQHQKASG
jgi:hypothetical protein